MPYEMWGTTIVTPITKFSKRRKIQRTDIGFPSYIRVQWST